MCLKIKNIFPVEARFFKFVHIGTLATYFIPFSRKSWKDETNGLRNWRVSHFLVHCSSESSELSYKTYGLRKIGKGLFKDFSSCSLMFQDAFSMTANTSLFLYGALNVQKQSKVNSFCANERAAICWPKLSVSFYFLGCWTRQLSGNVLSKNFQQDFPWYLNSESNTVGSAASSLVPMKPEVSCHHVCTSVNPVRKEMTRSNWVIWGESN